MLSEHEKAYHRQWQRKKYAKDPNPILERNAKWCQEHREQRLEYWRRRNSTPEHKAFMKSIRVRVSDLPPDKAEKHRAMKRAYAEKHAEKLSAYWKQYRKDHPEKTKAHNKANWHKRRATIKGSTVNPQSIKLFILGTREKRSVSCYYCGTACSGKKVHFDHIISLSKGGAHSIENLCVACPKCNLSKRDKPIQEWIRLGQQILDL